MSVFSESQGERRLPQPEHQTPQPKNKKKHKQPKTHPLPHLGVRQKLLHEDAPLVGRPVKARAVGVQLGGGVVDAPVFGVKGGPARGPGVEHHRRRLGHALQVLDRLERVHQLLGVLFGGGVVMMMVVIMVMCELVM